MSLAKKRLVMAVALVIGLALACAASFMFGARAISWQVVSAWIDDQPVKAIDAAVLEARLARTAVALVAGSGLACAGAAMQAITRNPLADPGLIGVNAGAALAVVVFTVLIGYATPASYLFSAMVGAVIAAALVWGVTITASSGADPITLVLAGAATSAGVASVTQLFILTRGQDMDSFRRWTLGVVSGRSWELIWPAACLVGAGICLLLLQNRALDGLSMGDDVATGLGINLLRARSLGALGAVCCCAGATALAGPLGFVGIIVPHLLRGVGGPAMGWVLGSSLLAGPILVIAADTVGRLIWPPAEVPAGVLVALIGVPVLVALVRRRQVVSL